MANIEQKPLLIGITHDWDSEGGDVVRTNNHNHIFRRCRIKRVRIKAEPLCVWILY